MDFDQDEKKIRELLKGYSSKPPEDLMKNYVEEVRLKIGPAPSGPAFGFPALVLMLALSAFLSGVLWLGMLFRPALQPAAPKQQSRPEVVVNQDRNGIAQESFEQDIQAVEEQADFEELSDNLMILEMLGEDTGLMDDSDTVEADLNFFAA